MLTLSYAFAVSVALAPLPADTPPPFPVRPPVIRQLRSHHDVIRASRTRTGMRVPSTIILPRLRNRTELVEFMRANYPADARDSVAQAIAWVFIDTSGTPWVRTLLRSGGSLALDSLALSTIRIARFEPARVGRAAMAVWVPLPVDLRRAPLLLPPYEPDAVPHFTPYTEKPELLNRDEVRRKLVQVYPPHLRDAGRSGTVLLWVKLNKEGRVTDVRVKESELAELNEPAMSVARIMVFSPAKNKGEAVPVWIQLPVVFRTSR